MPSNNPLLFWGVILAVELLLLYTGGRDLTGRVMGWTLASRGPKRLVGWLLLMPGTVLHETSHAVVVLMLGGRILEFVPFRPERQENGRIWLGYVQHTVVHGGAFGSALVGMAPLVGVPLAVWGLGLLLLPISGTPASLLAWTLDHPTSAVGLVWLVVGALISRGSLPSAPDHRDAPMAGLILAGVLGGMALLGLSLNSEFLMAPLRGWAQLLILPAAVSFMGLRSSQA